ncbi:zinc finger protein 276 isoform X2 [Rhinatrema bivittatum]|uniref:zinc finger protein 276 isoform X2 n=1 Tax=Rhinatrema bivittatum TaxID=194408 RepID=UPI0011270A13|nr:zinc finger protein 276 isoform X2 [Rhinatrema bivittatum]
MKRDRRGRFLTVGQARRLDRHTEGRQRGGPSRCRSRPLQAAGGNRARVGCQDSEVGTDGEIGADTLQDDNGAKMQQSREAETYFPQASGVGRTLSTGYCRLCHGKFSSRSLRNAFGKVPVLGESLEQQRRVDHVFFTDFQQLVGVTVQQDTSLPQFVCKNCHAQFYKCRSVLKTFIQKVNASPLGHSKTKGRASSIQTLSSTEKGSCLDLITSSPQCLHSLVAWTHNHAENCQSVPNLQSVLSSEYCGIIQAVWGCGDGHDYIMATESDCSAFLIENALSVKWEWSKSTAQLMTDNEGGLDGIGAVTSRMQHVPSKVNCRQNPRNKRAISEAISSETCTIQSRNSQLENAASFQEEELSQPVSNFEDVHGQVSRKLAPFSASYPVKDELSELSEGDLMIEEEQEMRGTEHANEFFQPFLDKNRVSCKPSDSREAKKLEEPKVKKKPGPKPGWKKIKSEREELPTIYKCPYQGCTAVYRGADGMKKHIREHHEEMRERPCPHPGCNKVFMIDRYLQRHVKLIHTEERNYICDQCGQTFKQRKHLSVHQMRHSGAKPLQCEVCGFQCRQRASLKYHMTKHKAEAELEFACDQCGKRFEKAHNLNVHMSMVHPLIHILEKPPRDVQTILQENASGTAEGQAVKPEQLSQHEPS